MAGVFHSEARILPILCPPKSPKEDEPAINKASYDKFLSFLVHRKKRSTIEKDEVPIRSPEIKHDVSEKKKVGQPRKLLDEDDGIESLVVEQQQEGGELQDDSKRNDGSELREMDGVEVKKREKPGSLANDPSTLGNGVQIHKKVLPPVRDSKDESTATNGDEMIHGPPEQLKDDDDEIKHDVRGDEQDSNDEFQQSTIVPSTVSIVPENKNSVSLKTTLLGGDGQFDEAIVIDPNHPNVVYDFPQKTKAQEVDKKEILKSNIEKHGVEDESQRSDMMEEDSLDELEDDIMAGKPKASEIKYEEDDETN